MTSEVHLVVAASGHPALLHAIATLCEAASASLISAAWQASLLVVCVAIALRCLPAIDASTRSATWTAVLAVSVCLALLPLFRVPSSNAPAHDLLHRPLHLRPEWSFLLASLWAGLTLTRAASLGYSTACLYKLWKSAKPLDQRSSSLMGVPRWRSPLLCTSEVVQRPSVIGFLFPRILIPADLYCVLSPSELEQIVLHESEHLRRFDDWTNLLQKMLLVLFPLNPALAWVERRLCLEREMACDERVLRATGVPKSYAACLVHLAERSLAGRRISLALGALGKRSEVARRIHHILGYRGRQMRWAQAAAFASLAGSALLLAAFTLSRVPQLVTFSVPAQEQVTDKAIGLENGGRVQVIGRGENLLPISWSAAPARSTQPHLMPVAMKVQARAYRTLGSDTRLKRKDSAGTRTTEPRQRPMQAYLFERTASPEHPLPVSTARAVAAINSAGLPQPGLAVLSVQSLQDAPAPHLVWTILEGPQIFPRYAAVPTSDGWLILEL